MKRKHRMAGGREHRAPSKYGDARIGARPCEGRTSGTRRAHGGEAVARASTASCERAEIMSPQQASSRPAMPSALLNGSSESVGIPLLLLYFYGQK